MAVTRQSWARSLLQALNLPTTTTNQQIIVGWTLAEGGAGPQFGTPGNTANYNPLNTTLAVPGSTAVNSASVQSYISWQQGLEATVQTIAQANMSAIVAMLQSGSATPAAAAATIDSSPWGTKGLTSALISGASVSATDHGTPIVSLTGGGVFGLGGTGTPGNKVSPSLWYVGDSSNPDQDYWTTINQYGQNAQWYVFSDGEALYAADGVKLMAQTPVAVIARLDPSVTSANGSYDNSAWNYTVTHLKKGNMVRRAALAKTTGPTEFEVKIICDIDEFRGGDVVYLKLFGPADGLWLVGECRRSVFEPFSTLTLVQALQPLNANSGLPLGPSFLTGKQASAPGSGTCVAAMLSEAATIDGEHLPYVWGGGHGSAGTPTGAPAAGFDCSGAVAAVLAAGGLWKEGSPVPISSDIVSQLIANGGILAPGFGHGQPECTLFDTPNHIFMRLNGQYFGTADGAGDTPPLSPGGGWIPNGQPGTGYRVTHVLPSVLGQQAATVSGA